MIRDFEEFANYKYKATNKDIFFDDLEKGISGVRFDSDVLLVLSRNKSLVSLGEYKNLKFIEFNNCIINEEDVAILKKNSENLRNVECLSLWDTKLDTLEIVQNFKNIECLSIAHMPENIVNFDGLAHLEKLKTFCLLKTGKIKDLSTLNKKSSFENLSIHQPTNLRSTQGVENLSSLKYLNIEGSFDTTYSLENLNGLECLGNLEKIKLHKVKVPLKELIKALGAARNIVLEIDSNLYATEEYKEMSIELKNITSTVFYPYIERGDYIVPVGKGKRRFKKSDKKVEEKLEKIKKDWDS